MVCLYVPHLEGRRIDEHRDEGPNITGNDQLTGHYAERFSLFCVSLDSGFNSCPSRLDEPTISDVFGHAIFIFGGWK